MRSDAIKLVFTYSIAVIVIVGGGVMLYFTPDDNLQLVVAGFIGAAISFVFNSESATRFLESLEPLLESHGLVVLRSIVDVIRPERF